MVEYFIFQIILIALLVGIWADVGRLYKKLREVEAYVGYVYHIIYALYYQQSSQTHSQEEKESEEVEDGADKVKESCVLEIVGKRGCVSMDEVIELCEVSKSFIINKLYRKKKLVKVDREYKTVCIK